MCGRFTFKGQDWPEIVASIEKPSMKPDFNISPQDSTPVIYLEKAILQSRPCGGVCALPGARRARWNPSMLGLKPLNQSQCFGRRFVHDGALFLQMVGMNGRRHQGEKFLSTINHSTNLYFQSPAYTNNGLVKTVLCILSAF